MHEVARDQKQVDPSAGVDEAAAGWVRDLVPEKVGETVDPLRWSSADLMLGPVEPHGHVQQVLESYRGPASPELMAS